MLTTMAKHGYIDDLDAPRLYPRNEPPRKLAEFALRLWAVREYRMLTVEETAHLSGVPVADINNLQSETGGLPYDLASTPRPPTDPERDKLRRIAVALAVDPKWLCGQGDQPVPPGAGPVASVTDDRVPAGIAQMLSIGLLYHAQRLGVAVSHPQMVPPPRPTSPIGQALAWLQAVEAAWVDGVTNHSNARFVGSVKVVVDDPPAAGPAWPLLHRRDLLADPCGVMPTLKPLAALFPAEHILALGREILPAKPVYPEPSLAALRTVVARQRRAWQQSRSQVATSTRSAFLPDPLVTDVPAGWPLLLARLHPRDLYPALVEAISAAWDAELEAIRPAARDAADRRAATDRSYQALLRWAYTTAFPGEDGVRLDVAVGQYRDWRRRMQRTAAEEVLERHVEVVPSLRVRVPRAVLDLLARIAGRIVKRQALEDAVEAICATAKPMRSSTRILVALRRCGWVREIGRKDYDCVLVETASEVAGRQRRRAPRRPRAVT